ncbi:MAG: lasso RiPP family leader peptide-containing protein [Alcaligenaceae bacterium]|nr:MAG: lasso RiPP family leader peptide-containing protein [Alcaligenaceae bacterium]
MQMFDQKTVGSISTNSPCLEGKLPYSPPSLREFGSVSELTMNGNGTGADGGAASKNWKGPV